MLVIEIVGGILLGMSAIGFVLLAAIDMARPNWAEGSRRDAESRQRPIAAPALDGDWDFLATGHVGAPDQAYRVLDAKRRRDWLAVRSTTRDDRKQAA
jgi:hypothetical protein